MSRAFLEACAIFSSGSALLLCGLVVWHECRAAKLMRLGQAAVQNGLVLASGINGLRKKVISWEFPAAPSFSYKRK